MRIFLLITVLVLSSCSIAASRGGLFRQVEEKKLILLGEDIPMGVAERYADEYDAKLMFTPREGALIAATKKTMTASFGPSSYMKGMINEFQSLEDMSGDWVFIIPVEGQEYFLTTLKNMDSNSVQSSKGTFILPAGFDNIQLQNEIRRVFGDRYEIKF